MQFLSVAQDNPPTNLELRVFADSCMTELAEGVLLVRLKSNARKINKMNEYGYTQQAAVIQNEQDQENKDIISAFYDHYTFSKVYFFYSEYSNNVRAKDFSEPFFLDENLQVDTSIVLPTSKFLTAEFGNVQRNESAYDDFYISNAEKKSERTPSYWAGPDLHFGALRMMTSQFHQLRRPFPRYVRTFDSISLFKRSTPKTVIKLNEKLNAYFTKY